MSEFPPPRNLDDTLFNVNNFIYPLVENIGETGPAGQGVPPGGFTNQVLAKASATDYDTIWVNDPTAGFISCLGINNAGGYTGQNMVINNNLTVQGQSFNLTGATGGNLLVYDGANWQTTGTFGGGGGTTGDTGPTGATGPAGVATELLMTVKNDSGVQINIGEGVMAVGSVGDRVRVAKAVNDGTIPAENFIGIAYENIPDATEGQVMLYGMLQGIDTSTYVVGDYLYFSPTIAGQLTKTIPISPSVDLAFAIVTKINASNGRIVIRSWSMGQRIGQLYDVAGTSGATGGNFLVYNSSSKLWTPTGSYSAGWTGATGDTGPTGATGATGTSGIPTGGAIYTLLQKNSATNYDTSWTTNPRVTQLFDLSGSNMVFSENIGGKVRVGNGAGQTSQSNQAIAIGQSAGAANQGQLAVSIGYQSGFSSQGLNAVAMAYRAGYSVQSANSIAIGFQAGQNSQGLNSIAIGPDAGGSNQSANSIALGYQAGINYQSTNSIALGNRAGYTGQGTTCIAIGLNAGNSSQTSGSISIGNSSGQISQGSNAVAVGTNSGVGTQGVNAVALGAGSGFTGQGSNAVAIGRVAGNSGQGAQAVGIGDSAGNITQGSFAVGIGYSSGMTSQGSSATAIGPYAGSSTQGGNAVAIGNSAGILSQGSSAVAIGSSAGRFTQGDNAVAIGNTAGFTGQHARSIILNSSGSILNSDRTDATFINPIRNTGTAHSLFYNPTSKEVSYNVSTGLSNAVCILYETAFQSVPSGGSGTAITWNSGSVVVDPLGFFNAGVSTTQIKPTLPGYYMVVATNTIGIASGSYYRQRYVLVNGSFTNSIGVSDGDDTSPATYSSIGNGLTSQVTFFSYFNGTTDYFETYVIQYSGSNQNVATKHLYCYKVG